MLFVDIWPYSMEKVYLRLKRKRIDEKMKTEKEIRKALNTIGSNNELTYGYRDDVKSVLNWVLDGEEFDGLSGD